jgi:hypothetical protein
MPIFKQEKKLFCVKSEKGVFFLALKNHECYGYGINKKQENENEY